MDFALLLLALAGHGFLWIGLVNRFHALGLRRRTIGRLTLACFVCAAMIPAAIIWRCFIGFASARVDAAVAVYVALCWTVAPLTILRLVWLRAFWLRRPACVRFSGRRRAEIEPDRAACHWLARLPFNEILRLDVAEWMLDLPRLPPALDGLSVVQLSDWHLTGRVSKAYFREVVRTANALTPDIMFLTGDLIDRAECLDWIPDVFGRLEARHGVYFILGNHDLRVGDVDLLRRRLEACGLTDLGGQSHQLNIRDTRVELLGDERPWIHRPSRADLESASLREMSQHHAERDEYASGGRHHAERDEYVSGGRHHAERDEYMFGGQYHHAERDEYALVGRHHAERDEYASDKPAVRIALAHTPDRLGWARRHGVDLLLTGHTHGGQIRIPPLGAIFCPTLRGVAYVGGVFHQPPTILHVSRGVSGDVPIRWLCAPEIVRLGLRSSKSLAVARQITAASAAPADTSAR